MYLTHTPKDSFCGIRVHHDSPHVISPKHFLASTGFSPFTKVCVGEMRMKQQQNVNGLYHYNTLSDVIQQHTQHTHYCICIITTHCLMLSNNIHSTHTIVYVLFHHLSHFTLG